MVFEPFRKGIQDRIEKALLDLYGEPLPPLVWNHPPKVELGDVALPVAFEVAKRARQAPFQVAEKLIKATHPLPGVHRAEVAGGGYINLFLDRSVCIQEVYRRRTTGVRETPDGDRGKIIIEHTNINPNKAAHAGHLRNAVLGDTLARAFRYLGEEVEIQNYIDDTGVQVADVILGLKHLRGVDGAGVDKLPEPIDEYCWDLYRDVTAEYEKNPQLEKTRRDILQDLEHDSGENARIGRNLTRRIVKHHLKTMERIGVTYDLLPWEGDILAKKFWERTFQRLKNAGTAYLVGDGKHRGCWVMRIDENGGGKNVEESEKVLVRSDGTVTYVGKDIAYQLWKFGLLDADFSYGPFHEYPDGRVLWSTRREPQGGVPPAFGRGRVIYNVIDTRQARLQKIVAAGLRALGYSEEATRSIHFSYEIVALSPDCARELGYLEEGSGSQPAFVEISGRRGQGVKANELIDILRQKAAGEIRKRNPDFSEEEAGRSAERIATGALRYFLVKFNRNRKIIFDFKDALSFEGDTGPYVQYSVVRASNILRKIHEREGWTPEDLKGKVDSLDWSFLEGTEGDHYWEIVSVGSRWPERVRQAVESLEISLLSRHCFSLAQKFNAFYHRYPVIREPDHNRKLARMLLVYLYREQMLESLETLGIPVPERM